MTVRMPVVYTGRALMPMKASRINRFVAAGRGKICFDRKLKIHYFKLLVAPSGYHTQSIAVGIDPGSTFDGFSVVSKTTHHTNIELIQRDKRGKTSIKTMKQRQSMNRRVRRSRLRHRPIRFDNRRAKKLAPTIRANVDFRKWLIPKLMELFPISDAIVEDVRFNHSKWQRGASFSHVEQGKTEFYDFLQAQGLTLGLMQGYETKQLRVNSFGVDKKAKAKDARSFEAHCLDSFVLACDAVWFEHVDLETGEITTQPRIADNSIRKINRKVIFIKKNFKIRRCLERNRAKYNQSSDYFRYNKGGIKRYFTCRSNKHHKIRVKPAGEHSNHPKQWEYQDLGRAVRSKHNRARYGGTVYDITTVSAKGIVKITKINKNFDQITNETLNRHMEITR